MEWGMRILSYLQIILLKILQPIFWYRDRVKPSRIPASNNPLIRLSACEIAKEIRERRVKSETLVKAYIDRIKEVNPIVNAVVEDRFEEALNDARLCDKKLNSGEVTQAQLEFDMPLFGVPFTVKESCSLKGLSYTGCTLVRKGIKASADSPIVASMKNAGGIPLCVSNTPELCCSLDASNLVFGKTCNPYDARRIAGGSSGGEGALLGAGASLIGIGSDIAGSIRIPGLFNGIFGHKPTPGIIPITGHFPISDDDTFREYLVLGPMARYAEDLLLAMRVMSGKNAAKLRLDETVDVKKLKVFYAEDVGKSFGIEPVEPSIKRSIHEAADYLQAYGAQVNKVPITQLWEILEIGVSMFFSLKNLPHLLMNPDDPKHERNGFLELVKAFGGMSQYTKSAIFVKLIKDANGFVPRSSKEHYVKRGHELRDKFVKMLGDDGVLLFPTFVSAAPPRGKILLQAPASVYSMIVNVFGFPASQVPMGLNKDGLPIGFQVIAGPNQDRLCLATARELEKRFGGWIPPSTC